MVVKFRDGTELHHVSCIAIPYSGGNLVRLTISGSVIDFQLSEIESITED